MRNAVSGMYGTNNYYKATDWFLWSLMWEVLDMLTPDLLWDKIEKKIISFRNFNAHATKRCNNDYTKHQL